MIEDGRGAFLLLAAMFVIALLGLTIYQTDGSGGARFGRNTDADTIFALEDATEIELKKWQDPKQTVPCFQLPRPYDKPTVDFFARNGCLTHSPGKPAVLLIGDSHSASLSLGLRNYVQSRGADFLQASGFYGPKLFCFDDNRHLATKGCDSDYTRGVMETIKAAKPDILVVDIYWSQPGTVGVFQTRDEYFSHIFFCVERIGGRSRREKDYRCR